MKPKRRLRHEREQRGWSQGRVAKEIGTTALTLGTGSLNAFSLLSRPTMPPFWERHRGIGSAPGNNAQEGDHTHPGPAWPMYDPLIPWPLGGKVPLMGRDALLAQVKQWLCTEARPTLVVLYGLPGVGKTVLAQHLVTDPFMRAHFPDGILWAGLGPHPNSIDVLGRWGMILGIAGAQVDTPPTSTAWVRSLQAVIGQRQVLLVLDDAWSLDEVRALQVGGPQCAWLVTTRSPLLAAQLAPEHTMRVPELTEQEAVALLAWYAPELVTQAPETVQTLVYEVGALPSSADADRQRVARCYVE